MSLLKSGLIVIVIAATFTALKSKFERQLPAVADGYFHPAYKPLADAFKQQIESGKERGGAFAIYQNGELVFDMWGGYADVEAERPWKKDTMTIPFSVSKGLISIVIASLVNKGLLDYKRPVKDYWPDFAQNNKENITLDMFLSHQAGLVSLDVPVSMYDILKDPTMVQSHLARQTTDWPAGSKMGYHIITFGMYADALVQIVDPKGRTSADVFLEDIAKPFGIDAFLNLPKEKVYRAARIYSQPLWQKFILSLAAPKYFGAFRSILFNPDGYLARGVNAVKELKGETDPLNNPDLREVTLSSLSAAGTATGLAKLYGILANGGKLGDLTLLNETTLKMLSEPILTQDDVVTTFYNITYGRGMWFGRNPKGQLIFGHPGSGGQVAFADPENKIGYSYITNFLSIFGNNDDPRFIDIQGIMYECADKYNSLKNV